MVNRREWNRSEDADPIDPQITDSVPDAAATTAASPQTEIEDLGTVRLEKIMEIRSAIRSGSYNEDLRLTALLGAFEDEAARMFDSEQAREGPEA